MADVIAGFAPIVDQEDVVGRVVAAQVWNGVGVGGVDGAGITRVEVFSQSAGDLDQSAFVVVGILGSEIDLQFQVGLDGGG